MARMNWNRPNGGYEAEPWRKTYEQAAPPKLDPLPVRQHRQQGHEIVIAKCKPGSVHAGAYRCVNCNKHLAWAPKQ